MIVARRAVLLGAGPAALAVCGCSSGDAEPVRRVTARYAGEFRTVARAAASENRAVGLYRALLAAPDPERSPGLARVAAACLSQHAEHAATWNAILRAGHFPPVTAVPGTSSPRSVSDLIALEDQAARAYVAAAGSLTSPAGIAAAAAIAPVEAMHAAILRLLLGEYPAPAGLITGDG